MPLLFYSLSSKFKTQKLAVLDPIYSWKKTPAKTTSKKSKSRRQDNIRAIWWCSKELTLIGQATLMNHCWSKLKKKKPINTRHRSLNNTLLTVFLLSPVCIVLWYLKKIVTIRNVKDRMRIKVKWKHVVLFVFYC